MKIIQVHNYYQQAGGEDAVVAAERSMFEERGHVVVPFYKDNEALGVGRWTLVKASVQTVWNSETCKEFRALLQSEKPDVVHCHNTFPLISPSIYWACAKEKVPVVQTLHNYRLLCLNAFLFRTAKTTKRHGNKILCDSAALRENQSGICELCVKKSLKWPGIRYRCYRGSMAGSAVVAVMLFFHKLVGTWSKKVTAYIALTEFQKRKMIEGGLPEQKIWVKPNFVQTTDYPETSDDVSRRANGDSGEPGQENKTSDDSASSARDKNIRNKEVSLKANREAFSPTIIQQLTADKKPYCLFVGRLSPEKGCDVLIRAWHLFTSNHQPPTSNSVTAPQMLIVGDGPERANLEQLAKSQTPNSKLQSVHFLGKLPRPEVLALMRCAQFLVFSSIWYETFGLTVLEAGLMNTPSIISAPTTTMGLVEDGITGLLFPMDDAAILADNLAWAFDHPADMKAMGSAASKEFDKKYSAEVNYEMLLGIYENVTSDR